MKQLEKAKRILIGEPLNVLESNIFRILNDVFLLDKEGNLKMYDYVQVMSGVDIVMKCLTSLDHRSPFDLIILIDYGGSADNMRIATEDTVKIIRVLKAYKKVPIILVSRNRFFGTYQRAGITTWIDYNASHDEFVTAINASMKIGKNTAPEQSAAENWKILID